MQSQKQTLLEKLAPATVYHMTHINNLPAIFEHGLLAHNNTHKRVDISNQTVNARRADIQDPIYERSVHEYVPFYFNPRNAMLYKTQSEFGRDIAILEFSSDILLQKNALFTNGNAASNGTGYSNHINELETINWNLVFSSSWNGYGHHVKQAMMSEVLIHKQQNLTKLMAINVRYQTDAEILNDLCSSKLFQKDSSLFFSNL